MTDYISRADAIEAVMKHHDGGLNQINYGLTLAKNEIQALPSADAVHIHNDGTLEVKVPNAQKVGRVLVMDTDSHIGGGLFYPADAVQGEWIHDGQNFKGGLDWCHCSECGYKTSTNGLSIYRYCPSCGARMKGGAE